MRMRARTLGHLVALVEVESASHEDDVRRTQLAEHQLTSVALHRGHGEA